MAEVVCLIDNDKVVILFLVIAIARNHLVEAAVADKTAVFILDAKVTEGLFPVASHRWREDDQYACVIAVGKNKTLGNHGSDNSLAQTDHIRKKAPIMAHHDVVALHHRVTLVGEVVVAFGKGRRKIVLYLRAKMVYQHTHVQLVWCRQLVFWGKVGKAHYVLHIGESDGQRLFPKLLKLSFAIVHIIVVLHCHVEFITWRCCRPQSLFAEIAATHDDPTVAVFIVLLWQTEVEFCM